MESGSTNIQRRHLTQKSCPDCALIVFCILYFKVVFFIDVYIFADTKGAVPLISCSNTMTKKAVLILMKSA